MLYWSVSNFFVTMHGDFQEELCRPISWQPTRLGKDTHVSFCPLIRWKTKAYTT